MRETILEINAQRIKYNLDIFRSKIRPGTHILVNLKGNAYGMGAVELGKFLENEAISYFSVAYINEGIMLRNNGIKAKLIVFNPSLANFQPLLDYQLEPEVSSILYLKELLYFFRENNVKKFPIHLKLDTGMHRAGIMPNELEEVISLLKNQKEVYLQSVFSHLAAAEDANEDEFTYQQIRIFEKMTMSISNVLPDKFFKHLLNTAGIFRFPQAQYDMIRPGLGIFGYNLLKGEQDKLKPIAKWVTRINQIKEINKGETVGYNRNFRSVSDNTKIALLPVGYADGFNRLLGQGRYYVCCKGKRVPVIGNVSMDVISVDVTNTDCQAGDKVILIDNQRDIYKIANLLHTIPYEIITGITQRVARRIN